MTLVKVNETLKRDFDGEKATEEVISIAYNIVDMYSTADWGLYPNN